MLPRDFIAFMLPGAVQTQFEYGLPAAAMISQAAQETGWGQYVTKDMVTGRDSKNLFNIKGDGPAGHVTARTYEYVNGRWIAVTAQFRAYNDYAESFRDYALLITGNPRYAPAVAVAYDPVAYIKQLQACGYATDPSYAQQIISIMRDYNIIQEVQQYMADMETPSPWAAKSIERVKKAGLMTADDTGFHPHAAVTREQLAVILDRAGVIDAMLAVQGWDAQKGVDMLKQEGIIANNHDAGGLINWGLLAAVVGAMRGHDSGGGK